MGYCTTRVKAFSNIDALIGFPTDTGSTKNDVFSLFNDMLYQVAVRVEVAKANAFGFLWLPEYKKVYSED